MNSPCRSELTVKDLVPFGQKGQRGFYALTLEHPHWGDWRPGQFVMLRPTSWGEEMTWARPFSICRVTNQGLVLFFQVVGRGTERMAQLQAGDKVLIWGPLGTAFAIDPQVPTLLLAGGIGLAPFAGYVDKHPNPGSLSMLFSHRLPSRSYPVDTFSRNVDLEKIHEQSPDDLHITLRRIREKMEEFHEKGGMALACGPMPFLKTVWKNALELDLPTQLSMEQRMACGVGACLGCVTTTSMHWADARKAGLPVQTCTSGPVFWAKDINLEAGGV